MNKFSKTIAIALFLVVVAGILFQLKFNFIGASVLFCAVALLISADIISEDDNP